MTRILNCAVRKNRSRRCRRLLAGCCGAAAFWITVIPYLLAVRRVYGLDGLQTPASGIPQLSVRIGTAGLSLGLYGAGGLLLTLAAAMLVCYFSKRFRRSASALIASAACLVTPLVLLLC